MAVEIFPVVHVQDGKQALEQTGVALEAGADGVYLIDHISSNSNYLLDAYQQVSEEFPKTFIGLNLLLLTKSTEDPFLFVSNAYRHGVISKLPDGIWIDDAHRQREKLYQLREQNEELRRIRYLGGVAFKYTANYSHKALSSSLEASILSPYIDVITTSGPGTGIPPSLDKIIAMKKAIGDKPLAVASGISADNFGKFESFIDQLLVSTSIETRRYSGEFDKTKIKDLIDMAHQK